MSKQSNYHEVIGDLFSSQQALAHCVSEDFNMGKGIAKQFRDNFGHVEELKSAKVKVGGVAIMKTSERYLYYMVTKEKYWGKPTLETLKLSLQSVKKHMDQHQITELSMPCIGCGLDKLKWTDVSKIIQEVFFD